MFNFHNNAAPLNRCAVYVIIVQTFFFFFFFFLKYIADVAEEQLIQF